MGPCFLILADDDFRVNKMRGCFFELHYNATLFIIRSILSKAIAYGCFQVRSAVFV